MENKGWSREQAEADWEQLKIQEKTGIIAISTDMTPTLEAEMKRQEGFFVNGFLERKKARMKPEKFTKERLKLAKEAGELWQKAREGKRKFHELEEQAQVELITWNVLEKPLRQWLENEAQGRGWTKEQIENTIKSYYQRFEHYQRLVKERLKPRIDPDQDLRQRLLNPETRKQAIQYYLVDCADKHHFLIETINVIFEELEKLKYRR
jgi:hypothetical protein